MNDKDAAIAHYKSLVRQSLGLKDQLIAIDERMHAIKTELNRIEHLKDAYSSILRNEHLVDNAEHYSAASEEYRRAKMQEVLDKTT